MKEDEELVNALDRLVAHLSKIKPTRSSVGAKARDDDATIILNVIVRRWLAWYVRLDQALVNHGIDDEIAERLPGLRDPLLHSSDQ